MFSAWRERRARATLPEGEHEFVVPATVAELDRIAAGGLPDAVRIEGNMHVTRDLAVPHGLIIRGDLVVGEGSRLDSPAEVFGDVHVSARATLVRPIVAHGSMLLGRDAVVPTSCAFGDVLLSPGARVNGEVHCGALYLAALEPSPALVAGQSAEVRTPQVIAPPPAAPAAPAASEGSG